MRTGVSLQEQIEHERGLNRTKASLGERVRLELKQRIVVKDVPSEEHHVVRAVTENYSENDCDDDDCANVCDEECVQESEEAPVRRQTRREPRSEAKRR